MVEIKHGTAKVVAADTQAMTASLDEALLQQARLCATLVEAAGETELSIVESQPVLEAVAASMVKLVESRSSVAVAVKQLTGIQRRSNLAEVSFGCPGGWYRSRGSAETTPDIRLAA